MESKSRKLQIWNNFWPLVMILFKNKHIWLDVLLFLDPFLFRMLALIFYDVYKQRRLINSIHVLCVDDIMRRSTTKKRLIYTINIFQHNHLFSYWYQKRHCRPSKMPGLPLGMTWIYSQSSNEKGTSFHTYIRLSSAGKISNTHFYINNCRREN